MPTVLKFVLLIIGAALLALAARALLLSQERKKETIEEPQVSVMVAAADLPAGLLLRAEDIDWREMPKSKAPDGAVKQDSAEADTLAGVLLRRDVHQGDVMLARNVIRHDAPGFLAAALQPGMRAISVSVDNVSGNAGLIQPGDYVDMILVQQSRSSELIDTSRARSVVSETVVENVRVIAVGSVFQQEDKHSSGARSAPARTVTLEMMPRAAEAVTVASRLGSLTLALRSFALTDPLARQKEPAGAIVAWEADKDRHQPVWAGDVSRAIAQQESAAAAAATAAAPPEAAASPAPPSPPPAAPPTREITILRGAERSTVVVESRH